MHKEIELKLITHQAGLELFANRVVPELAVQKQETLTLINAYFDTPDALLSARKMALRIRDQNGCLIQTLKTRGTSIAGLHQRNEWEWPIATRQLDAGLLAQTPWPADIEVSQVAPVFETNFLRTACLVEFAGASIEVACDSGAVVAGEARQPLHEIELELLAGPAAALFSLGRHIARAVPVFPGVVSKAEQGYRLAAGVARPFVPECTQAQDREALVAGMVRDALMNWQRALDNFAFSGALPMQRQAVAAVTALKYLVERMEDVIMDDSALVGDALAGALEHLYRVGSQVAHRRLAGSESIWQALLACPMAADAALALGAWTLGIDEARERN